MHSLLRSSNKTENVKIASPITCDEDKTSNSSQSSDKSSIGNQPVLQSSTPNSNSSSLPHRTGNLHDLTILHT